VNELLRQAREARGWSLNEAADQYSRAEADLGLPPSQTDGHSIGRWERGERKPRPPAPRVLAHMYGRTPAELGLAPEEPDVIRREFLRLGGALLGAAALGLPDALEPWERLGRAVQQPSRTDLETVRHLEGLTATFEDLEAHASPHALVRPVAGHLGTITDLLEGTPPLGLRRELLSMAAETAGLLAWLSWDVGSATRSQARAYVRTALEAAREAGDSALGAYLMGTMSVVDHPKDEAAQRLRYLSARPFGFDPSDATPTTQAWLEGLQAEAHSMLGHEADALRSLEAAVTEWARPADDRLARPRVAFFDAPRLAGEQGICLARLGHAGQAQGVLTAALADLDRHQQKSRGRLLIALASTQLQQGDVDEACRLAETALDEAVGLGVQPNVQDVVSLRRQLEPWRDRRGVRDLDERLQARNLAVN
jgi:transcriptional regulator with XRE-family HTH domain